MTLLSVFILSSGILGFSLAFVFSFPINGDEQSPPSTRPELWTWPVMCVGLVGSGMTYVLSKSRVTQILASLSFLTFFSWPFFFYEATGSDISAVTSMLFRMEQHGESISELGTYQSWPLFFVLSRSIALFCGISNFAVTRILVMLLVILLSLSFSLFRSRSPNKAMFMPLATFIVSSYVFLNWQAAPQSIAFVLLVSFFALNLSGRRRFVLCLTCFLFVLFSHGFVSLWFIGISACLLSVTESEARCVRRTETFGTILALVALCVAHLVFYAWQFLRSFQATLAAMLSPSVSTQAPIPMITYNIAIGLPFSSGEDLETSLVKVVAWVSIGMSLTLILLGLPRWLRDKQTRLGRCFLGVGALHMIAGSIVPVLGIRGIQLCFLGLANSPCYSSIVTKYGAALLLTMMLLFTANLSRMNAGSTNYLDQEDVASSFWLAEGAPTNHESQRAVVASLALGVFLSGIAAGDYSLYTPRTEPSSPLLPEEYYLVLSPEYSFEIQHYEQHARHLLSNATSVAMLSGSLVLDTGQNAVYLVVR